MYSTCNFSNLCRSIAKTRASCACCGQLSRHLGGEKGVREEGEKGGNEGGNEGGKKGLREVR